MFFCVLSLHFTSVRSSGVETYRMNRKNKKVSTPLDLTKNISFDSVVSARKADKPRLCFTSKTDWPDSNRELFFTWNDKSSHRGRFFFVGNACCILPSTCFYKQTACFTVWTIRFITRRNCFTNLSDCCKSRNHHHRNAIAVFGHAITVLSNAIAVFGNAIAVFVHAITVFGNVIAVFGNAITVFCDAIPVFSNAIAVFGYAITVLSQSIKNILFTNDILKNSSDCFLGRRLNSGWVISLT